jgi:uncharacterized protein (TIGR02246 family)
MRRPSKPKESIIMAGELTAVVKDMFDALDRRDADGMLTNVGSDMQGIDEISKGWMRGRDKLAEYLRGLVAQVSDVRSELRDLHEVVWGDAGVLTFWLEQDYTLGGEQHHISAPSTTVLRREDGAWKIVLFHSAPLPE